MAKAMSDDERRGFLGHGTRTGKLATVRDDGRPHVAPVWFVPDGDDLLFMTGADTVKGRNLRRDGRAALVVDDERPPYSFVLVEGPVGLSDDLAAMRTWSTRIAARYMGADKAEEYGERNAAPGELLVRLRPDHVTAVAGLAE